MDVLKERLRWLFIFIYICSCWLAGWLGGLKKPSSSREISMVNVERGTFLHEEI